MNREHPTGIGEETFRHLTEYKRRHGDWRQMIQDPEVYAKGCVRHPDHATIHLPTWHRVYMNTEHGARAMRHVAFLD